ncbi:hypothetical protein CSHISOI_04377, partial [Colletotrichum shisoi]
PYDPTVASYRTESAVTLSCVPSIAHCTGRSVWRMTSKMPLLLPPPLLLLVSSVTVLLARQVPFSPDGPHRSGHWGGALRCKSKAS